MNQETQIQRIAILEEQVKRIIDHETRIRHLERWVWTAIGALAVIQLIPGISKVFTL